ncbi:ORF6N domain-containing protein [Comamonas sp. MYb21]|uniref:ORF6N domain-containing protein n=1 Tax=Comamonas sp. MYb21 TaxID=1848648 RepID=UPI00309FAAC4
MSNIVKINDTDLQVIEYRGQRVATLAQIDEVHARPEGTARRTFNEHKHRLVEGEDFYEVTADEIRTQSLGDAFAPRTAKGILVTESGYLMLVKSFTDDLAWQVQRQLVTGYFRAQEVAAPPKSAHIRGRTALEQVKLINFVGDAIKNVPGIRLGRLAAAKLKAFSEQTGLDFSDFRRALPALPLDQMVHLNPTQIGQRIQEQTGRAKVSGQAVNKVLLALGLQRKVEDGYVLTEAGTKFGEIHDYKAENDHSGLQIDWYESVVNVVRDNLPAETTKRKTSSSPAQSGPQGSAA